MSYLDDLKARAAQGYARGRTSFGQGRPHSQNQLPPPAQPFPTPAQGLPALGQAVAPYQQPATIAAQPGLEQIVRTYHGKHVDRDFAREAARLARSGWMAGTPAYGGQRRISAWGFLWWGFGASRKPSTCTVVYTRPAR